MVFLGREISEQRDYGETVADLIDTEVNRIITDAHKKALEVLTENRPKLEQLAQALLVHETLEGDDLDKVFNEPPEQQPPVETTPVEVVKAEEKIKASIKRKIAPPLPSPPIPKPRQAPQPS